MVKPSDFVNGSDVQWRRLARALVGATFGAVFMGWASIVLAVSDLVIRPLEYVGEFYGNLLALSLSTPARLVASSWPAALGFVREGGPLGFVFALGIVLLALYVAVRLWRLR